MAEATEPHEPARRADRALSERDRLARLGADCRLLVFGFWMGRLPEIARLHFLTVARALPPDSRYVLLTYRAQISDSMQSLLDSCGIEAVDFDLPRLMTELGAERLIRTTRFSSYWSLVQRLARRPGLVPMLSWFGHRPRHGFVPRANPLLGAPPMNGVILSNYLRVAVSTIVPEHTLYADIDFAFPKPLDWIFRHESFVYRWERFSYANSALFSVKPDSPVKKGALLRLLVRMGAGRCRVLFVDDNCKACGLEILPCDRLDPLWSQLTLDGVKCGDLFARSDRSAAELGFLRDQFDTIHWHNQWNRVPDKGSAYDLWLGEIAPDTESRKDAR